MVTQIELADIVKQFCQEERRFSSIRPGDLCYEVVSRGIDVDYHPAVVASVNVDKRYVEVIDVSSGQARKKYSSFLTESEMLQQGVSPKGLAEDRDIYKSTIDAVLLPKKKTS